MEAIYNSEIDRIMQRVQSVELSDAASFTCVKLVSLIFVCPLHFFAVWLPATAGPSIQCAS